LSQDIQQQIDELRKRIEKIELEIKQMKEGLGVLGRGRT
jgi:peptidoglycan hydrolase CwlO-like protein